MRGYLKPNYAKDGKTIISYRIAVSLGRDPKTAKYQHVYETVKGKRQAEKRLAELVHQRDSGILNKPGKDSAGEYLQTWLRDYCTTTLSPRTVELYSYLCRLHLIPEIGKIPLVDLKPQHLQALYSKKLTQGLSARTVQLCHVVIHKALKNAVRTNVLMRNVADSVDKPQIHRPEMHAMNEDQLNAFLEAAKQGTYYPIFFTYLFTGMRRSELLAVRWRDVDLLGMQISVSRSMQYLHKVKDHVKFKEPKTKQSRRTIALTPANALILKEHREQQNSIRQSMRLPPVSDDDLVFTRDDFSPMLPDSVGHAWAKLVLKCGLKGIRLHDARHTHASLLLKQGVHPKIVQERLGHSTISTTLDTYSHVAPGLQHAAANGFDSVLKKESKLEKELGEIVKS